MVLLLFFSHKQKDSVCGQCSGEEEMSTLFFCSIQPRSYLHDLSKLNDAIWLFVTNRRAMPPSRVCRFAEVVYMRKERFLGIECVH